MAKARELRRRIKSVENTRQITKTMEMVATSRLKRAQDRVVAARPYAAALGDAIGRLHDPGLVEQFPLLRQPEATHRRVALVFITSNRGLCGGFNANLIRRTASRLEELRAGGAEVELHAIGRKGISYFRYIGQPLATARDDIGDRPTVQHAVEVIQPLMHRFATNAIDVVEVIFAKFNNAISTPPTLLPVLPIDPSAASASDGDRQPFYLLRPSARAILEVVLPLYVENQMYRALVETAASEHGARRTAMKSATDNAGDMIDYLRRTYNRARQAQITQEIAEIVGGAESLKG
jgi:F-type H+-transporting ATPase subunit gamma